MTGSIRKKRNTNSMTLNMADGMDPWVGSKATFSLLNNKTVPSISSDGLLLLYTAHYYTGLKKMPCSNVFESDSLLRDKKVYHYHGICTINVCS